MTGCWLPGGKQARRGTSSVMALTSSIWPAGEARYSGAVHACMHVSTPHPLTQRLQVVRATLVSALAVLLKRGWLEEGETPASRAAFFMVRWGPGAGALWLGP